LLLAGGYDILPAVDDIIVSPQWQQLAVEELRGTLLIIGATDTGKSSLARYIFQRLARNGTPTAYLDADMGQSTDQASSIRFGEARWDLQRQQE